MKYASVAEMSRAYRRREPAPIDLNGGSVSLADATPSDYSEEIKVGEAEWSERC